MFPAEDLILKYLHVVPAGLRLKVHSDIPVASGLGSSAAATVAGLALAQLAAGDRIDYHAVFRKATAAEQHPDNAAPATFGGLVLAANEPVRLKVHAGIAPAFAVPSRGINTKKAREILPRDVSRETAIAQSSRAAALVLGLQSGDAALIAHGMDDQLAVPYRRDLIPGFATAVKAGLRAGAYGVTISGAGSSLLAFGPKTKTHAIAKAMADAFTTAGNSARPLAPKVAPKGLAIAS